MMPRYILKSGVAIFLSSPLLKKAGIERIVYEGIIQYNNVG